MAKTLEFAVSLSLLMGGNFSAQATPAVQKLSALSEKVKSLQAVSKNIAGYQKQAQNLTALRTKLDAARAKVKDMQTVMRQGGTVNAQAFTRANQEAARLQEQVQQNIRRLGEFRAELRGAGVDTNDLAGAQARLQSQTDQMTRAQERLAQAQSRYARLKDQLSWGNIRGAVLEGVATFSALRAPVKIAADFEEAMQRVKAVGFSTEGADLEEFAQLREQAIKLGATTKFTAIQAANAQENLARAGMQAPDIIATMPALLDMAAAEGMEIAQAADILAGVQGGMNMKASDSVDIADILAYVSASSKLSIAGLGEALKQVAPVAAGQGIKLDQLTSYVGILANKGFDMSTIGTGLRNSILRITDPKITAKLNALGVATKTKSGRLVELPEIMIQLNKALSKKGEADQAGIMGRLFGTRNAALMTAFMQASASGQVDTYTAQVREGHSGQAKRMADINLDSLNGQITLLGSAWDGFRQKIGDMFSPIVREGVEKLTAALSWLTDIMNKFPKASEGVVTVLTVLAGTRVLSNVLNIGKALVKLPGAWLEARAAAQLAASAAGSAAVNTGAVAAATTTWGAGLQAILGWLPLILSLSVLIWQNWEKITEWAEKAGEAIKSVDTGKIEAARSGTLSRSDPDYGLAVMNSTYMLPAIKHAAGGIMTAPHVGLVAEAGPEAIIPLSDKSRGIPLLMRAAEILGVSEKAQTFREISQSPGTTQTFREITRTGQDRQSYTVREAGEYVSRDNSFLVERSNSTNPAMVSGPPININITATTQDEQGLASRIAEAVRQALTGILEEQERLNYGAV